MNAELFQERIGYNGDLKPLFSSVVHDYQLGKLIDYKPILQGYEDFNVVLETDSGKYLAKVMASSRSKKEVDQYFNTIRVALDNGVSHPKMYKNSKGDLYTMTIDNRNVRLIVMNYVEGSDFYKLGTKPDKEESIFLCQQAAKINKLDLHLEFVYDGWAVPNFLKEYEGVEDRLGKEDLEFIKPPEYSYLGCHFPPDSVVRRKHDREQKFKIRRIFKK